MANPSGNLVRSTGPISRELLPGQPYLGQQGPPGGTFAGWVLVQIWDVPAGRDGCVVQMSLPAGRRNELMQRAAKKLAEGLPAELDK